MENILVVNDLRISFGSHCVLDGVSFCLKKGEILGIIGPNGAGKTVLLNLISGMLSPASGSILFEDQDITRWNVVKRTKAGIGRTFQVPRPFEQMTAYENVVMSGIYGADLSEAEASWRASEIFALIGMEHRMEDMAGKLGLLERKRLEIGAALASQPKLILLDEVAGGLTESEIKTMLHLVEQIRSMGISIMWIEHVLETMVSGTDRVICLADGNIVTSGKPLDVLASPRVKEVYLGGDEDE